MPVFPRAGNPFYDAAAQFVDECLRGDGSLFTPGRHVWAVGPVSELYRRFVENPDESKDADFVQKLRGQLEGASREVVQLAAEMLYILLLPQDTDGKTKSKNVAAILSVSPEPIALPDDLSDALGHGIASYGAALTRRFPQYVFLLEFAREWTQLSGERRAALLSDADDFYEFVIMLPRKEASSQVEALLHITFPGDFEPIVSIDVKRKIIEAFPEHSGDDSFPKDKRLALIRHELAKEYGDDFSFWDTGVRDRWASSDIKTSGHRRAWFIRGANDRGVNRVQDWLGDGYISIGWGEGVHLRPGMNRQELEEAIERAAPDATQQERQRAAGNMERFLNLMSEDDLVVTVDGSLVYVGIVSGEPRQLGTVEDGALWQRRATWVNPEDPSERDRWPADVQSALKTQMTLTDLTKHIQALEALLGAAAGDNWGEFLLWSSRLYENESFDRRERDYKVDAAAVLSDARTMLADGGDWLPLIRQALGGENNLVNWRARATFLDWCAEQPESAIRAIGGLWESEDVTEEAVNFFADRLESSVAPGNRVNIASVLLMGIDPTRYPPFRPTVDERARNLLGISERAKSLELEQGRTYRPDELAVTLGVSGRTVRGFLRAHFPRPDQEKNTDWHVNADIARAVADHFRPSAATATAGARYFAFVELVDELFDRLRARRVELRDRLDAQSLMWWVTSSEPPEDWSEEDRAAFRAYQRGEEVTIMPVQQGLIPPVTEELARALYLPRPWLQLAVDLLNEKRQLIFYGPPGTGKTYVAQALGEHVRATGGGWQLVQFHPAYSYEDFFEGYRPTKPEDNGGLQFDLRKGPLRLLAEKAAKNPEQPYLLVIDEINRGNIAKIFGELYFLLEYRHQPIRLQYSPEEPFELPENLFLIGTMNTADRSIALVDSALRRRFYFFPFLPRDPPVRDVLRAWLDEQGYDEEPSLLLQALNSALHEALPDDEFAIGPSYFMPEEGPPDLERVWRYAIRPLLEERFYGARRPDELDRDFGLAAMRARTRGDDAAGEALSQSDEEVKSST